MLTINTSPPKPINIISPMLVLGCSGEGKVNTKRMDSVVNANVAPYIIVE